MDTRLTKNHYKIREVAEIIGVSLPTLRFWEKEFDELEPRRSAHNQRYYSKQDIETLQIIQYLVHIKGLKIEAAKEYLHRNKKNVSQKLKIIEKLEKVREELEVLLHSLNLRGQKMGLNIDE